MRALTHEQKRLLDNWYKSNNIKDEPGIAVCDVVQDLLTDHLWERLTEINDTEILSQTVNNYINEKS